MAYRRQSLVYSQLLLAALTLAFAQRAAAAEPTAQLRPLQPRQTVFGDEEVRFRFAVEEAGAAAGTLYWSVQHEARSLLRGEVPLGPSGTAEVTFQSPPVKPGVVLPLVLSAEVIERGEKLPVAQLKHPLWVFSPQAFAGQTRRLEKLGIRLYDPAGETSKVLQAADVPFEEITSAAALESLKQGLVVVGEGVSLREERALPTLLLALARRGIPVLCLQPVDGELRISSDPAEPLPELHLASAQRILQLDKRLDSAFWGEEPLMAPYRLNLSSSRAGLAAEVTREERGWPWLELVFPPHDPISSASGTTGDTRPAARLTVVCFPLIAQWDNSPTPRYLLTELFQQLYPESPAP